MKLGAIPWKQITESFSAISDFQREILELQENDQIASLLDSTEAAPFLNYSRNIHQFKHSIYEGIRNAFLKQFESQVLDNVLITEYYFMNEMYFAVVGKVAPYLQTGKELLELFRKELEESIPNQKVQNGILFLVLSSIDQAVKERVLLLHYDNVFAC